MEFPYIKNFGNKCPDFSQWGRMIFRKQPLCAGVGEYGVFYLVHDDKNLPKGKEVNNFFPASFNLEAGIFLCESV